MINLRLFAFFVLLSVLVFGSSLPVRVAAQKDFQVTDAALKPDEPNMTGRCPRLVKFTGAITANGKGTVKYTFTRSDGATAPVRAIDFTEAGTQTVSTDWTLGDISSLPRYEGWQAIKILSPNEMESSHDTGSFGLICSGGPTKAATSTDAVENIQSSKLPDGKKISRLIMDAVQLANQDSAARAEARKQAVEADRARFEPAATALVNGLRGAGVDLDGYLAASKQFVEMPAENISQSNVDSVNRKFAGTIRNGIAKMVGAPGIGDILQGQQAGPAPTPGGQGQPPAGDVGVASCCSTNRFEPPFETLFTEADLGARSVRPGEVRQLAPKVRSAIVSAPHSLKRSWRTFTVPASARHVSVTVNLETRWVIGLSGLGYAHVWLGLDMNVSTGSTVVCGAPHLEQDNQWTWAGGFLMLSDHRSGTSVTRTCRFDRSTSDPTEYAAGVSASSDGTFFGASGGYGDYYVDLGPVDVTTCP
jgi:hypothetical protein